MFSLPALSRKTAGLTGTAGMMLLVTLVLPVQAAEKDELATVMRQLDQVRAALDRARTASLQATPHDGRIFSTIRVLRLTFRPCRRGSTVISRPPGRNHVTAVP